MEKNKESNKELKVQSFDEIIRDISLSLENELLSLVRKQEVKANNEEKVAILSEFNSEYADLYWRLRRENEIERIKQIYQEREKALQKSAIYRNRINKFRF